MQFVSRFLTVIVMCFGLAMPSYAHEVNPAYLEVREVGAAEYSVLWKQPVKDGQRLRIRPVFPEACMQEPATASLAPGVVVERWQIQCDLSSGVLEVTGLDRTLTDVFVRIEREDADPIVTVLRAGRAEIDLALAEGAPLTAYVGIGVEHILFGFDHLLFVLGLLLLVQRSKLIATITAFTVAHSITLALSALANVSLPGAPVEIIIAMSIVLLALEALRHMAGQSPLSAKYPWAIAFGFGLLHGFGFAGALSQIGLPAGSELLALGLFNLGVEVGQLLFVAAALIVTWFVLRWRADIERPLKTGLAYFIGVAGTYWVIERVYGLAQTFV